MLEAGLIHLYDEYQWWSLAAAKRNRYCVPGDQISAIWLSHRALTGHFAAIRSLKELWFHAAAHRHRG